MKTPRIIKSFGHAFRGMLKAIREEGNIRIQIFVGLVVIILGIRFHITKLEWLALAFAISSVILMELINTVIERVTDVLKPRIDTYVKEIKDLAAAAVLFAALVAIAIGLAVLGPYLWNYFFVL